MQLGQKLHHETRLGALHRISTAINLLEQARADYKQWLLLQCHAGMRGPPAAWA